MLPAGAGGTGRLAGFGDGLQWKGILQLLKDAWDQ